MSAPEVNTLKQRVYLQRTSTGETVYLAWFQLADTHDLYWGSTKPGLDMESEAVQSDGSTGLLTLEAPEGWAALPTASHKHSYHRSGMRHTTAGGSGAAAISDSTHVALPALSKPTLLCGVLTGALAGYPLYSRGLNRHNSRAVILQMDEDQWSNMRHYFEFYITPSSQAPDFPPMLVNASAEQQRRIAFYSSFSEPLDRILAVRHLQVPLQDRSDKIEYWLIPGRATASLGSYSDMSRRPAVFDPASSR
jgi:hypothetical protein